MTDDIAGIDDTDGIGNFNVVRFLLNQLIAPGSIQPVKISKQKQTKIFTKTRPDCVQIGKLTKQKTIS